MNLTFDCVTHNAVRNTSAIDEIIAIKQEAWPYPYESQLAWISDNLRNDDIHCMFRSSGELVGYANLLHIRVFVGDSDIEALGVGNVCTAEAIRGRGLGHILRDLLTLCIRESEKPGMLLCRDELVSFYSRNPAWCSLSNKQWLIDKKIVNANLLVMGFDDIVGSMSFDRVF